MKSTRITKIYGILSQLFAQQRKSLLSAAKAGFDIQDRQKFEWRHARIVRLYRELAKLNPEAYDGGRDKGEHQSGSRVA